VNLWDNLLREGLDGKKYTEQEARAWLDHNASTLFTEEAYGIFKGYRNKDA